MHTRTSLVSAVLLGLLFVPSLRAADADTNAKDIKQLKDDLAELRKQVRDLRKDFTDLATLHNKNAEQLDKILRTLEDMERKQAASEARISRAAPLSGVPGGVPATGTITIQNVYSAPATVYINGQPYRVEAGQTRTVPGIPAGTIQYTVEVDGYGTVEPSRTDTMRTGYYRITIYPRSMPPA